jgi:hypothetical protein
LFHAFCHKKKRTSPVVNTVWVALSCKFRFRFFTKSDHWRRIFGIQLRSWNEDAEFSLENTKHTTSKESASVEIKCESCCSFSSIFKELFQLSSYLEAPLWTQNATKICQNTYEMACNENSWKSGITDLCCIMTTLRVTHLLSSASFWLIKKLPCVLMMGSKGDYLEGD